MHQVGNQYIVNSWCTVRKTLSSPGRSSCVSYFLVITIFGKFLSVPKRFLWSIRNSLRHGKWFTATRIAKLAFRILPVIKRAKMLCPRFTKYITRMRRGIRVLSFPCVTSTTIWTYFRSNFVYAVYTERQGVKLNSRSNCSLVMTLKLPLQRVIFRS